MKSHLDAIRATLTQDLSAGLVVFLVALPLCLGIAMASDAPLMSGMITGIIAGLLVSVLSGSTLSVSGPAAGLTIIVARAIHELGSFDKFLTAVLLSGVIQVVFGILRAGTLSGFFPNSVIKGMLAGIGTIIILKQIPHALGVDADYEGDMNFWQITDNKNTFTEIMASIGVYHWNAALVAGVCLAIMIFWPQIQQRAQSLKFIPASLVTVGVGVLMTLIFSNLGASYEIAAAHLVQLPGGLQALLQEIRQPLFSAITDPAVLKVGATLAIVGSIESLLSLEATDKLDPERRVSSANRELLAQGTGNILCGLLGGIPMTAVIVRSSANVYAGAKSRTSCFVHGVLLLMASLVLYPVINLVPHARLLRISRFSRSTFPSPS